MFVIRFGGTAMLLLSFWAVPPSAFSTPVQPQLGQHRNRHKLYMQRHNQRRLQQQLNRHRQIRNRQQQQIRLNLEQQRERSQQRLRVLKKENRRQSKQDLERLQRRLGTSSP
ncbi:hypothetical protein C1752_01668 [Acaryochloris thomasi RCC1774]|uniref:Uncharacterized protein n=1 Tax=Acaryochloris thomasi RCC1774 TaxID=1764569 RepID=A0A2W1JRX8_9CYAN|nr:hypothetical protein [Acaryochloris thomasi]PZD74005.1 hypothetical protein C1752_01668 [Acaryochloris thomasi RCC1774]